MGNVLGIDPDVTRKTTEVGSAGDIRFASSAMKGFRVTNEDSHTLSPSIPIAGSNTALDDHALFGVYDGHGGNMTSVYAGNTFVAYLSKRPELQKYASLPSKGPKSREDVVGIELLRAALTATFYDIDDHLRVLQQRKNEEFDRDFARKTAAAAKSDKDDNKNQHEIHEINRVVERSGSTCVVVVLTPSHIVCANAGDSRAFLKRGSTVLPLSFDHKPSNIAENIRITAAGGFVKSKRVDGDLAVSRGLGDFAFKDPNNLNSSKVTCKPDLVVYPRDRTKDEWLLLGCDGLFDVLSNAQCAEMIHQMMEEGETDIGLIVEELLDICLERNSRDNMTAILVCLEAAHLLPSGSPLATNAVSVRRMARQRRLLEFQAKSAAQNAANLAVGLGLTQQTKNGTSTPAAKSSSDNPQSPLSGISVRPTAAMNAHSTTLLDQASLDGTARGVSSSSSPRVQNVAVRVAV